MRTCRASGRVSDSDASRRYAQLMVDESKHLTRLLDNLLAYARIADTTEVYSLRPIAVDAFVEQDTAKRLPAVSETEIAQFYEQNKDRAQGRTLDDLRAQIKDFLESQRKLQARAQLVEALKASSGGAVKVMLDPPRYTVAVETHDPIRGEATAPVTLVEFSDYQ